MEGPGWRPWMEALEPWLDQVREPPGTAGRDRRVPTQYEMVGGGRGWMEGGRVEGE